MKKKLILNKHSSKIDKIICKNKKNLPIGLFNINTVYEIKFWMKLKINSLNLKSYSLLALIR